MTTSCHTEVLFSLIGMGQRYTLCSPGLLGSPAKTFASVTTLCAPRLPSETFRVPIILFPRVPTTRPYLLRSSHHVLYVYHTRQYVLRRHFHFLLVEKTSGLDFLTLPVPGFVCSRSVYDSRASNLRFPSSPLQRPQPLFSSPYVTTFASLVNDS